MGMNLTEAVNSMAKISAAQNVQISALIAQVGALTASVAALSESVQAVGAVASSLAARVAQLESAAGTPLVSEEAEALILAMEAALANVPVPTPTDPVPPQDGGVTLPPID